MTDFFLLLMIPRSGDELQGIKRGIIEMIDAIAINKADGDNVDAARRSQGEYRNALHLFPAAADGWNPQVLTCSALQQEGIAAIWDWCCSIANNRRRAAISPPGAASNRWIGCGNWSPPGWRMRSAGMRGSQQSLPSISEAVSEGKISPFHAARKLLGDVSRRGRKAQTEVCGTAYGEIW